MHIALSHVVITAQPRSLTPETVIRLRQAEQGGVLTSSNFLVFPFVVFALLEVYSIFQPGDNSAFIALRASSRILFTYTRFGVVWTLEGDRSRALPSLLASDFPSGSCSALLTGGLGGLTRMGLPSLTVCICTPSE